MRGREGSEAKALVPDIERDRKVTSGDKSPF